MISLVENVVAGLAVLAVSGASAVGLGHFFLSVIVKNRRHS